MILGFYFARRFLITLLVVLAVFGGIVMLIDMVEQIRRHAGGDIGLGQAARLAALNMPAGIYQILPLITLLAAIALFLALARSSELVVTRAIGLSPQGALAAPVITALLVGGLAVAVFNPLVAATSRQSDLLAAEISRGEQSVLSVSREGLWLRQGAAEGQVVIRALRANLDGTELMGVTFIGFGEDGTPVTRIEAASARLVPGRWLLSGARQWQLGLPNPEQQARVLPEGAELGTDLTADSIRDSFGTPSAIAIWDLPGFIDSLDRAGFSARQHRVWLQMELALPLLMAAMVLVAAGFTMRHTRFGGTGIMVLLALLSGFAIFFLRNFAQVLGENGQIPVALAAWSPPLAATMLAVALLLHLEDG